MKNKILKKPILDSGNIITNQLSISIKILFLLLIVILSFAIRYPFMNIPLERDEGGYAYIAQALDRGEVPYRDIYDIKPLLLYFIYWIILHTFGSGFTAIRLFAYSYSLISTFFIYKIGKELHTDKVGLISASIFIFLSSDRMFLGFTANSEVFMILPIILSLYYFLIYLKNSKYLFLVLCGIMSSLAIWIKQPAVFNLIFILFLILFYGVRRKEKIIWYLKAYSFLFTGIILVFILLITYLVKYNAFNDFVNILFKYNISYISSDISIIQKINHFWNTIKYILQGQWVFWLFFLYGFRYIWKKYSFYMSILFLWFLFSFIAVSIGWRFTPHYFQQLLPAFSLTTGISIVLVFGDIQNIKTKTVKQLLTLILIISIFCIPIYTNINYWKSNSYALSWIVYDDPVRECIVIGKYLKEKTTPEDKIFIMGSEPQILYYAQRKSASKYIFIYPLTSNYQDTLDKQKEAIKEIETTNPKYILYINMNNSLGLMKGYPTYIFDKINELLISKYELDGIVYYDQNSRYFLGKESIKHISSSEAMKAQIILYKRRDLLN